MLNLICSDLRRFLKNKILYFTIALCGFIGWFTAHQAKLYGNTDDVFMLGFLMVQAGGFSLIIGAEFSCKAVRNKLIIGYTKVKIYFSELIVTLLLSLLAYAAYIIPLFGLHEVVEKTGVSAADAAEIFACILAVNLTITTITVAVTFVFSARAMICAVASIAATIGVCFVGIVANDALSRPQYWEGYYEIEEYERYKNEEWLRGREATLVEWGLDEAGQPLYEYRVLEPNENYIERGTVKFYILRAADLMSPYNMLNHIDRESSDFLMIYDKYGFGSMDDDFQEEAEKSVYYARPWDLDKKLAAYLCLSILATAAGCLIFKKRDMK